jgi:hypothetical protein
VQWIQASPEFRTRTVQGLYATVLDRQADPSGLANGVNALALGMSSAELAALLLGSEEYFALQGGTSGGFLAGLYEDALGRPIGPLEAQAWATRLAAGATRQDVAASVLASPEGTDRRVDQAYQRYLGRPAGPAGLAAFSTALRQGLSDGELARLLLASKEYYGPN